MADITSTIRGLWSKGMESIGNAANSVADSAHNKADEIILENRRREIMNGFAATAYELFKQGAKFPPECEKMLLEAAALDEQLAALRKAPEKARKTDKPEKAVPSLRVPETPTQLVPGHLVKGLGPVPSMNMPPMPAAAPVKKEAAAPVAVIESIADELEAAAQETETAVVEAAAEAVTETVEAAAEETADAAEAVAEIVEPAVAEEIPVQEAVKAALETAVPAAAPVVEMIFTSAEDDEPVEEQ